MLLKVVKSVEERYPFAPVPDWVIEKLPVDGLNESGAEAESELVLSKPKLEVATAVTTPAALVCRKPDGAFNIAKLVVVALAKVAFEPVSAPVISAEPLR